MKKETVNSFQGGMNKDLNSLVTPNDVLTDALNAQILTFNGDELSLQTDAGNTKIKVGDDFVKLSEGFYPLGMKEYGGVLYIVSGKKEEGEEDLIEFGSYPAPEFGSDRTIPGIGATISQTQIYRPFIINNNYFKTGNRINFNLTSGSDISHVTNYSSGLNLTNQIYHVKLLHQLENGVLDLTNDIWEKFKKHKNETSDPANHWLDSDTFLYYCPTQYKGKLQLRVILDEPEYFKLKSIPEITDFVEIDGQIIHVNPNDDNNNPDPVNDLEYPLILSFDISYKNSLIEVEDFIIKITYSDGNTQVWKNFVASGSSVNTESNIIAHIKIPYKNSNYETYPYVDYEIIPSFKYAGNSIIDSELPAEFLSKYKIKGTRLLESRFRELYFSLSDPICSGNGFMYYTKAILRDRNSNVDDKLDPTELEFKFAHEKYADDNDDSLLGTFKIVGTKINIVSEKEAFTNLDNIQKGLVEYFRNMLNNTDGEMPSDFCEKSTIYVRFNLAFELDSQNQVSEQNKLSFSQPSISLDTIPYITIDGGRTFKINVDQAEDIHILFNFRGISGNYVISESLILNDNIYDIGITTKLYERRVFDEQPSQRIPSDGSSSGNWIVDAVIDSVLGRNINTFYYESLGPENEHIMEYIMRSDDPFRIEKTENTPTSIDTMLAEYDNSMSRFKITVNPVIEFKSIPYGKSSYVFNVASGEPLGETTYLNMENYSNYVRMGHEDVGYVIVKQQDACTIDKIDNAGDYNGSGQPGRSSGSHRGSSKK